MSMTKHFSGLSKTALLRRAVVPMALAASLPSFAAPLSTDAAGSWAVTHTQAHPLALLAAAKDAMASGEAVSVTVALKMRDSEGLENFLRAQKVDSPAFGAIMTQEQFVANYSPTQAQAQAVADHLIAAGFRNVEIAPNRLLVTADGTAGTVQRAFRTGLAHTTVAGRDAIVNLKAPQVPAALSGVVEAVLGLQTADIMHTMYKKSDLHPVTDARTQATHGFNPTAFPTIYHAGTTATASLTRVGIIAEGNLATTLTDLTAFENANGIAPVSTLVTRTGASSSDTSGRVEWDLDSQDIVAMAGGRVSQLIFYDGPSLSNANLTTEFNRAVTDNTAKAINVSLGECESSANGDGSLTADDNIFRQAQAQGQTFAVSSGDSGSDECNGTRTGTIPSYPASSQYVVAVGGTTLTATASNGYSGETVWSGAGGSPSRVEALPTWQRGVIPSTTHRGVADVGFDADPNSGAIIRVGSSSEQVGGTSLAAPLFTAAWARIESSHNNSLGFAAPLIYAAYARSRTPFHDITSGSNGGESARVGYDYPTGLGSFDIQALNAGL